MSLGETSLVPSTIFFLNEEIEAKRNEMTWSQSSRGRASTSFCFLIPNSVSLIFYNGFETPRFLV